MCVITSMTSAQNDLILLNVNQRLLVLMDNQYLGTVDNKKAEAMFLLKNQLSTTKYQLLFNSWITYSTNQCQLINKHSQVTRVRLASD